MTTLEKNFVCTFVWRSIKNIFHVDPDNGWHTVHSALPQTNGGDTPRRPGQRVVTICTDPDNGCWHSALPSTTGTLTQRRPGQRGQHKKLITSSLYEKYILKTWTQPTISIIDVRLGQKRGVKSRANVPLRFGFSEEKTLIFNRPFICSVNLGKV